jgi:radical SAM protein with 4Fe4S-binding SPASM domain
MATNKPFNFSVQWRLTERCNLACKNCYQEGRSEDELSLPEIKKVIVEVSDMITAWSKAQGADFCRSMQITGGEPFLRQDLLEIIKAIKQHGFAIHVLTNGTLITRRHARELANLGVSGVRVSIEGCEEVHDAVRGKGSYAASVAGIEHLIDAGILVTLNVSLSPINAPSINKVIACGTHVGARRIGFSRLVPSGKGSSLLSQMLSPQQVKDLYEPLLSLEIRGVEIVTGDPVASQMKERLHDDGGNVAISGCAAGVSGLTIQPDGTITPCRRMPIAVGNVRNDSLTKIWEASPILTALRDRNQYRGKCGACKRWAVCRGCRAIAYAYARSQGEADFLADDPQCFLESEGQATMSADH